MKQVAFLTSILAAFLAGFAIKAWMVKPGKDDGQEPEKIDRPIEENRIRKTEAAYDEAWKRGNMDGIMACFAEDAMLLSPRGDVAIGKEQIRQLLSEFLQTEAVGTRHTSRISRISFVTDAVAVVDGEAFIEGAEGLSDAVRHHIFADILVREGDAWRISQIRAHAEK